MIGLEVAGYVGTPANQIPPTEESLVLNRAVLEDTGHSNVLSGLFLSFLCYQTNHQIKVVCDAYFCYF